MTWLGLLIGGIVGSTWGFKGTLLGALIGALIGMYLRRSAARANVNPAAPARGGEAVRVPSASDMPAAGTDPAMLPVRRRQRRGFAHPAPTRRQPPSLSRRRGVSRHVCGAGCAPRARTSPAVGVVHRRQRVDSDRRRDFFSAWHSLRYSPRSYRPDRMATDRRGHDGIVLIAMASGSQALGRDTGFRCRARAQASCT
jgi:hypothetical protein